MTARPFRPRPWPPLWANLWTATTADEIVAGCLFCRSPLAANASDVSPGGPVTAAAAGARRCSQEAWLALPSFLVPPSLGPRPASRRGQPRPAVHCENFKILKIAKFLRVLGPVLRRAASPRPESARPTRDSPPRRGAPRALPPRVCRRAAHNWG